MRDVCEGVIGELKAVHRCTLLEFSADGDLQGDWDGARLGQVVSNLVSNAIQHGSKEKPVRIHLRGESDEILLSVQNEGSPLRSDAIENIHSPLVREAPSAPGQATRLKLGLYIAREILAAHGGTLHVTSSHKRGTTFTARWPRLLTTAAITPSQ
jgi:signal transduction histidine kinase